MRVPGLRQLTQTGTNNLAQWDIICLYPFWFCLLWDD